MSNDRIFCLGSFSIALIQCILFLFSAQDFERQRFDLGLHATLEDLGNKADIFGFGPWHAAGPGPCAGLIWKGL